MPYIHVSMSKKITDAEKEKLMKEFGQEISILEGKSEKWLMVNISDGQSMCFQGDDKKPCAIIEASVYGAASADEYGKLTGVLTETVSETAEIPGDRIYVKYTETPYWGWNGENF
jgi:phenylpyruvate tautomerase PptA (4-oxalocrotonate tautomerase family)